MNIFQNCEKSFIRPPFNDTITISSSSPSQSNLIGPANSIFPENFLSSSKKIMVQKFIKASKFSKKKKKNYKNKEEKPQFEKMQLRRLIKKNEEISNNPNNLYKEVFNLIGKVKDLGEAKPIAKRIIKEFSDIYRVIDKRDTLTSRRNSEKHDKLLYYLEELKKTPRTPELVSLFTALKEKGKGLKRFWLKLDELPRPQYNKKNSLMKNSMKKNFPHMKQFRKGLKREENYQKTESENIELSNDYLGLILNENQEKRQNNEIEFIRDLAYTEKQLMMLRIYFSKMEGNENNEEFLKKNLNEKDINEERRSSNEEQTEQINIKFEKKQEELKLKEWEEKEKLDENMEEEADEEEADEEEADEEEAEEEEKADVEEDEEENVEFEEKNGEGEEKNGEGEEKNGEGEEDEKINQELEEIEEEEEAEEKDSEESEVSKEKEKKLVQNSNQFSLMNEIKNSIKNSQQNFPKNKQKFQIPSRKQLSTNYQTLNYFIKN